MKIHPETLNITGETSRKYYEICTSQEIYNAIKGLGRSGFQGMRR